MNAGRPRPAQARPSGSRSTNDTPRLSQTSDAAGRAERRRKEQVAARIAAQCPCGHDPQRPDECIARQPLRFKDQARADVYLAEFARRMAAAA